MNTIISNATKEQSLNKVLKHLDDTWNNVKFNEESSLYDESIKLLSIDDEIIQALQNDQVLFYIFKINGGAEIENEVYHKFFID